MDISDPLKYDQILKFSLSASQWSQRALKREYLPSMYVNFRRKSKLSSTYRYIDKTFINYCRFWSNRILLYFPVYVPVLVYRRQNLNFSHLFDDLGHENHIFPESTIQADHPDHSYHLTT